MDVTDNVENVELVADAPEAVDTPEEQKKTSPGKDEIIALVVDSAPLLKGTPLRHVAQRFCTIPEVVGEIRDKHSREYVRNLPFELELITPTDEAIKAGKCSTLSRWAVWVRLTMLSSGGLFSQNRWLC